LLQARNGAKAECYDEGIFVDLFMNTMSNIFKTSIVQQRGPAFLMRLSPETQRGLNLVNASLQVCWKVSLRSTNA